MIQRTTWEITQYFSQLHPCPHYPATSVSHLADTVQCDTTLPKTASPRGQHSLFLPSQCALFKRKMWAYCSPCFENMQYLPVVLKVKSSFLAWPGQPRNHTSPIILPLWQLVLLAWPASSRSVYTVLHQDICTFYSLSREYFSPSLPAASSTSGAQLSCCFWENIPGPALTNFPPLPPPVLPMVSLVVVLLLF